MIKRIHTVFTTPEKIMPNNCAAYGCNHRMSPETKEQGITFHLLPPETDLRRKLWIANSRRIDPVTRRPWNPTSKYIYFCSEHFVTADFEYSAKAYSNRRLKENAVPTVFTFPTTLPESPENPSTGIIRSSQNIQEPDFGRGEKFCRGSYKKKLKHRKVVMLPKKIKQLQDASSADMESVTIISYQHLDYDEKFQPMFEKAILDLQCPADSDYGEEEEEQEYYENEAGECLTPTKRTVASVYDTNDNYYETPEILEDQEEEGVHSKKLKTSETNPECEQEVNEGLSLEGNEVENSDLPQETEESEGNVTKSGVVGDVDMDFEVEEGTNEESSEELVTPSVSSHSDLHSEKAIKRRVPVIIEELSVIRDFEELRKKAFKIAEDNIKLKRQVTSLEHQLEEFVS